MKKVLIIALFVTTTFVGCVHRSSYQPERYSHKSHNFLGIMKVERDSFDQSVDSGLSLSTDELWSQDHYSGDKISLLWGLITIKDY